MFANTRRIISGIDDKNQSTILSEDQVKAWAPYPMLPAFEIQELFYTEDNPQSIKTRNLNIPYDIQLPEGAFRVLLCRMMTVKEAEEGLRQTGQEIPKDWTKFNLHSTNSADYIYILSGEIDYVVGEKVVKLKQGDFLTQIAPEHTWVNNTDQPCMVLCIMIGLKSNGEPK